MHPYSRSEAMHREIQLPRLYWLYSFTMLETTKAKVTLIGQKGISAPDGSITQREACQCQRPLLWIST